MNFSREFLWAAPGHKIIDRVRWQTILNTRRDNLSTYISPWLDSSKRREAERCKERGKRNSLSRWLTFKFPETTNKLKMRLAEVHKCLTIPLEVASIKKQKKVHIYI